MSAAPKKKKGLVSEQNWQANWSWLLKTSLLSCLLLQALQVIPTPAQQLAPPGPQDQNTIAAAPEQKQQSKAAEEKSPQGESVTQEQSIKSESVTEEHSTKSETQEQSSGTQPAAEGQAPQAKLRIGLALAGGGTRGCAHIGVIRVLEEEGIPIDCIAGTSIGSIVGGLYASGVSLDDLERIVCSKKLMRAYDTVPIPVRMALIPIFFVPHLLGWRPYDGLYRGGIFRKFIRRAAPEGHREIESFKIPFAAIASNLLDGKAYSITSGDIGKAVQASSAIPFLRRPVEIGDKLFIDGGIVVNLPCQQARDLGADFVIAVDIDDDLRKMDKDDFRKIGSVSDRALNMHLSTVDSYQLNKADFVIHPDVTGIALLDGNPKDARRAIKAGEDITRLLLPALKIKLAERSGALAGKLNKTGEKNE